MPDVIRAWLAAILLVLALAAGLGVGYLLWGRAGEEAQARGQREILRREGQIADLERRLKAAEERARMEAEQRRIADEALRRAKVWK